MVGSVVAVLLLAAAGICEAHQLSAIGAELRIEWDGTYSLQVNLNIEASVDTEQNETISPGDVAQAFLSDGIRIQFDEGELTAPEFGELEWVNLEETYPGQEFDFTQATTKAGGVVPQGAESIFLQLSEESAVALVLRIVKGGTTQRRAQTLFAGEYSQPIDLTFLASPLETGDPFVVEEAEPKPEFGDGLRAGLAELTSGRAQRAVILAGLLLFSASLYQALGQGIVLWAATFVGQVFMWWAHQAVRPELGALLLAIGVLSVAVDNLCRKRWDRLRFGVVALVGLMMGMATRAVEFEKSLVALMGFYEGLLLGILALSLLFWLVLGGFWRSDWFGPKVMQPLSYVLAGVGIFWMLSAVVAFF